MNSYELSRVFFDWAFENPEKVTTNHVALYFFAIEHCNRLGWKEKFGFPTEMAKEAIGIKSYKTYTNTINDLVDYGFIKMIQRSKNQYSANIIALVKNTKALAKALAKATQKHDKKESESNESIDKPITNEPNNNEQSSAEGANKKFDFKQSLIDLGVAPEIASDWMIVRSKKRAANTETAFNTVKKQIEISGRPANDCIAAAASNSWQGFRADWLKNLESNGNNTKSTTRIDRHKDAYREQDREFAGGGEGGGAHIRSAEDSDHAAHVD